MCIVDRSLRVLALGVMASLTGCLTGAPEFELSLGAFAPAIDGDAALSDSVDTTLEDVDISSDLDLDDQEVVPYGRIRLSGAGFNVHASAFESSLSSLGTLTANFGDITAGSDVDSDLDLRNFQAAVTFNLIDVGFLRIAPGLGVDYFDIDLQVEERTFGFSEQLEAAEPVPLVYLDVEVDPPILPIRAVAEVGAMGGAYGDFEGRLIDAQALVFLDIAGPFELFGGYRLLLAEYEGTDDDQDFEADLNVQGWMIGGSLRF